MPRSADVQGHPDDHHDHDLTDHHDDHPGHDMDGQCSVDPNPTDLNSVCHHDHDLVGHHLDVGDSTLDDHPDLGMDGPCWVDPNPTDSNSVCRHDCATVVHPDPGTDGQCSADPNLIWKNLGDQNSVCRPGYVRDDRHLAVDDLTLDDHHPVVGDQRRYHLFAGRKVAERRSANRLDAPGEGHDLGKAFALLYSREQV